jgi:hypothetical protein
VKLTLINHAAVRIDCGDVVILCDPWLDGAAFQDGWDLLVPTPLSIDAVMRGVTHVWISHEHPDHFVPRFLAGIAKTHGDRVEVLFQATRDGRVRGFCEGKCLKVRELPDGERVALSPTVSIRCGAFDFYDSWLHVDDGTATLLNVNDCALQSPRAIARLARRLGPVDVLLTQFSYAAWKGGRDHRAFRDFAARRKLETMRAQIAGLKPRFTVPFASFVYFSNVENAYLNDGANDVAAAVRTIVGTSSAPVALFPGDTWEVGAPPPADALPRWAEVFAHVDRLPKRPSGPSVPLEALATRFAGYRERVFARNSEAAVRALRRIPGLGAFHPVRVRLTDLQRTVSISVVDGFAEVPGEADVAMHSAVLDFVLANEFGFDTLTVNGRFEATPEGFARMTKSLALGSLNAMGITIGWSLVKDAWVVALLLEKLAGVMTRLRTREAA